MKYLKTFALILPVLGLILILAGLFIYKEGHLIILGCCLCAVTGGLTAYIEQKKKRKNRAF